MIVVSFLLNGYVNIWREKKLTKITTSCCIHSVTLSEEIQYLYADIRRDLPTFIVINRLDQLF